MGHGLKDGVLASVLILTWWGRMPSCGGLPTRPGLRRLAIGAQVTNSYQPAPQSIRSAAPSPDPRAWRGARGRRWPNCKSPARPATLAPALRRLPATLDTAGETSAVSARWRARVRFRGPIATESALGAGPPGIRHAPRLRAPGVSQFRECSASPYTTLRRTVRPRPATR